MGVKIKACLNDKHKCEVVHLPSSYKIKTDAPADHFGEGLYFSPTDLVAVALATCIITTISIVAQKSGWEVSGTWAEAEKHMQAAPSRRIGPLIVQVHLPRSLTPEARERVEQVGHSCPVHASLRPDCDMQIYYNYDV
jgi:putative redox protein